jgi:serine phosphatase RsbU (regulator of sigma subunit)
MIDIENLYESLASSAADPLPGQAGLLTRARQLSKPLEAVTPETNSEQLRIKFAELGDVATIAVTEGGRPIGMINRNIFMEQYARPYARELYGRKSCIAFMDKTPLVVDENTPIETLVKAAVESGGKVLADGFITTENGLYLGVGTGFSLMKAMSDIETEKTRQLMSSISYASLIQRSHLVESDQVLQQEMGDYGLMWLPRDVVGGDAYFLRQIKDGIFCCVFDCTGHGVPGAFMTLIVLSFLEQQIHPDASNVDPGEIIGKLNVYVKRVLRQADRDPGDTNGGEKVSNDGLDAAMFVLAPDQKSMRFASAKLTAFLAKNDGSDILAIEGDKTPIGYSDTPLSYSWQTQEVDLGPDCLIAIPTDGVIDQIGEIKRIAHGKKRLVQFIYENRADTAQRLISKFNQKFSEWQGKERRRDDVSMLAFKTKS